MRYSIHKKDGVIKEGLVAIDQLSGDDMMSPLYIDDETVDMPITINLQSYLYISEEGFYAFRIRSNNPDPSVCPIPFFSFIKLCFPSPAIISRLTNS